VLAVAGLTEGDRSIVGLMVSHGHPEHYGLVDRAHASVPVYLGEATQRILREAAIFTRGGADLAAAAYLRDRTPLRIGPFTVTPYLVDHSAFDAYALLVEAAGRRLFYSGDFRAHGRKSALLERLLREPPPAVNVLLLEGTNIGSSPARPGPSEYDVEERCVKLFKATSGMVLACYSAQNIDRLVTLFRAAQRSGRTLVLDLYAATMARATGRSTIPQADWDGVRVFVPLSQRIKVKEAQEFERVAWLRDRRLFARELAGRAGELVMTFRGSMAAELDRAGCLNGARAV
jgi:ribonuclease J